LDFRSAGQIPAPDFGASAAARVPAFGESTGGDDMQFTCVHNNINVFDMEKSLKFYEEALGLTPVRRVDAKDGSFRLAFLEDGKSAHQIELTWLRDREKPYNLGDNEIHIACRADYFNAAYAAHDAMGVICYNNKQMGVYFISDPDGYWIEIVPTRAEA
jgi:lactoylglutathione lyase